MINTCEIHKHFALFPTVPSGVASTGSLTHWEYHTLLKCLEGGRCERIILSCSAFWEMSTPGPWHSDQAVLLKCLTCSGHFCIEASSLIALMCIAGALQYLLCAQDGSSSSLPHLLHILFKLPSVSQERGKWLLKIMMWKLFMAWPALTLRQPLHNEVQRSPYLEEHSLSYSPQVTKGQPWLFNQFLGMWGLDIPLRCQILLSRICQAAFLHLLIWMKLW